MLNWSRAFLLVVMAASSAGCTAVAMKVVDEVDNTVSKLSQSDCQLARVIHGMDVCRNEGADALLPAAYCYKTLGGVDCYDRADPADRPIQRQATSATKGLQ
jgi:hypothetical protein